MSETEETETLMLHNDNFVQSCKRRFRTFLQSEKWSDVTLACKGQFFKAHRFMLATSSPFFNDMFEVCGSMDPIVVLNDVSAYHMKAILQYIYTGECQVQQDQIMDFLRVADSLVIYGLHQKYKNQPQAPSSVATSTEVPPYRVANSSRVAESCQEAPLSDAQYTETCQRSPQNIPSTHSPEHRLQERRSVATTPPFVQQEAVPIEEITIKDEEYDYEDLIESGEVNIPDDVAPPSAGTPLTHPLHSTHSTVTRTQETEEADEMLQKPDVAPQLSPTAAPSIVRPAIPVILLKQEEKKINDDDNDEDGYTDNEMDESQVGEPSYQTQRSSRRQAAKRKMTGYRGDSSSDREEESEREEDVGESSCDTSQPGPSKKHARNPSSTSGEPTPSTTEKRLIQENTDGKLTCDICQRQYSTKHYLVRHVKNTHAFSTSSVECLMCNKTYKNSNTLSSHMTRDHNGVRVIPCEYERCDVIFPSYIMMKQHVYKVHSSANKYICPVCNRFYIGQNSVYRHIKHAHKKLK